MDATSWYHRHSSIFTLKTVCHTNSGELNDKESIILWYPTGTCTTHKNNLNFCDYVILISEREDRGVKNLNQSRQCCL